MCVCVCWRGHSCVRVCVRVCVGGVTAGGRRMSPVTDSQGGRSGQMWPAVRSAHCPATSEIQRTDFEAREAGVKAADGQAQTLKATAVPALPEGAPPTPRPDGHTPHAP